MSISHFLLCTLFLVCIVPGLNLQKLWAQDTEESSSERLFEALEYSSDNDDELLYRLLKPETIRSGEKYPLVIFLHGAGERGDDNKAQLKHGMFELCTPHRREKFACFAIAPQCPKGQVWAAFNRRKSDEASDSAQTTISRSLELTLEVVDRLVADYPIDADRIYVTGLSMGGFGTWDALVQRPDFFAAAMPICGGGDPSKVDKIKHVPIACFHGAEDKVVPAELSRNMIDALRKAGSQPMYVEYADVGHDSWKQAYASDENWQWMFGQRRGQRNEQSLSSQ